MAFALLLFSIVVGYLSAVHTVHTWFDKNSYLNSCRTEAGMIKAAMVNVVVDVLFILTLLMLFYNIFLVIFAISRYSYLSVVNFKEYIDAN